MNIKELKIIDASTVLAGPSVATFFAELGASVIKVENPNSGDVTRTWKLPSESKESTVSAYFSSVNYGKEYLQLDYSNEDQRTEFLKLIATADILLTNFKYGDAEKFNLTDEVLHSINSKLIHGKISGFGKDSDRVAYDLILQAESGFMSMNGTPGSGPVKMPVALIDVLAAHQLKEGLLVALLERSSDGKGKNVDVSLYEAAISSLINQSSNFLNQGFVAKRVGSLHPNIAPYGEIFLTQDDKMVTFAIGSNNHFFKLCQFLDCLYLVDDELFSYNQARVINRLKLQQILQDKIELIDSEVLMHEMGKAHIPAGIIKSLDEVLNSPEAQEMILEEEIDSVLTKRIKSVAFHIS